MYDPNTTQYLAPVNIESGNTAPIDGWKRVSTTFQIPNNPGQDITVHFRWPGGSGSHFYVDDVRMHPADAAFTTYVYDPLKLWLTATLDDRNYATFYNYDEEGVLTRLSRKLNAA